MPALLNSRSMCSVSWTADTCSRKATSCDSSDTSATNDDTTAPSGASASASSAVSAMFVADTSHMATLHPSAASWRTSSRPIPVPPPVTTAILPAKESIAAVWSAYRLAVQSEDLSRAATLLGGDADWPAVDGEPVFDEPWQGRAFAMAFDVLDRTGLPWDAFREHLVAAIADEPERPYYESWLVALERLALDTGAVDDAAIGDARNHAASYRYEEDGVGDIETFPFRAQVIDDVLGTVVTHCAGVRPLVDVRHAELYRVWTDGAPGSWRLRAFDGDDERAARPGAAEGAARRPGRDLSRIPRRFAPRYESRPDLRHRVPSHLSGADHPIAGHEGGELVLGHRVRAGGSGGEDEVADRCAGVPRRGPRRRRRARCRTRRARHAVRRRRGTGRRSSCTRSAGSRAAATGSTSTTCRRPGCAPLSVFSTTRTLSPSAPAIPSSAIASVPSASRRALNSGSTHALATTRAPWCGPSRCSM